MYNNLNRIGLTLKSDPMKPHMALAVQRICTFNISLNSQKAFLKFELLHYLPSENSMQLTSFLFLLFFLVVSSIYYLFPSKYRWIWLLLVSYCFYGIGNINSVGLLILVTVTTWYGGNLIAGARHNHQIRNSSAHQKIILATCVLLNIGILVFYKYSNFAIYNLNRILRIGQIPPIQFTFNWIMPIGISFFILQALTYPIDIYRGKINPEKNPLKYALFVSFFPQILSGPIGRAKNMLPQISTNHQFDFDRIKHGMWRMLWGFFQKMVIGDRLSIFIASVFDDPVVFQHGGIINWIAMVFFGLQIYYDFAGYSNIAIGAAQILGYSIPVNFLRPYFSKSVTEFWKRWHISLTSWFRDYLYIPLGGNRVGKIRHAANILIVFLVSGLWHGANWTFIIWGLLNGFYQLIELSLKSVLKPIIGQRSFQLNSFGWKSLRVVMVFFLTDFAWIFFRSNTIHDAFGFIKGLFYFNPQILLDDQLYQYGLTRINMQILLIALVISVTVSWLQRSGSICEKMDRQPFWFRWAVILTGIFAILLLGIYGPNVDTSQFIYTKF